MGPRCAHQKAISRHWGENRRENQNKREEPKSPLELLGIVQRVFHYFVFAFSSLAISVAHLYKFWWATIKHTSPPLSILLFLTHKSPFGLVDFRDDGKEMRGNAFWGV